MSVLERILAIKLLAKQEKNPESVNRLGVHVSMVKKEEEIQEEKMPVLSVTGDTDQETETERRHRKCLI